MKMNNKGFTLIEIIIAFTIALFIVLLVFSGFRLSTRSYDRISEKEELSQRLRVIHKRLGWLIKGIYPYKDINNKTEDKQRIFFVGNSNSIGFVTTSIIPETERIYDISGLKWVYLFVDNEGLKERDNIFYIEDNLESSSNEQDFTVIDPYVESLEFEYFDQENNEWLDEWDSEKENLPSAIKIKLRFVKDGKTYDVPEMVFSIRASSFNP
jgi:general secretion pathway protein J